MQKQLTHGFTWEEKVNDFTPEKTYQLIQKDKKGNILEVGVEYPEELHKKHNKLSFLAETMKVGNVGKLVQSLNDKKAYVVHSKNLNKTLKHGLKLKKSTPGY